MPVKGLGCLSASDCSRLSHAFIRDVVIMFRFENNKTYRMPAHFGGTDFPGPDFAVYNRDVVSLSYTYTTNGDQLANYVPEGCELIRPEVNIGFSQFKAIDRMAGGYYNLISD